MTSKPISAGLLMYASDAVGLRVLLAHPGGPYFAKKDDGAWTIPKGLVDENEDLLTAAQREFVEETGYELPESTSYLPLGSITQKNGKVVHAWGFSGSWPSGHTLRSNSFTIEWPPRSGQQRSFPEIDRAEMFSLPEARRKINPRQVPLLDRLELALGNG